MFFKVIRVIAAFGILLGLVGCSSYPQKSSGLPEGELLFSVMMTRGAFSGPVNSPNGWAFYVEQPPSMVAGPFLCGYHFKNGEINDRILGGSASGEVVKAIESIDFEPFDWESEVAIANARLGKTLQDDGMVTMGPITLDGAEYEIVINSKHGRFCMREWNPWPEIDFYAPYSEKIAKLKRVIDTLALYLGRHKLGPS